MTLCHTSSHLTEHNALFVSVAARHRTRRTALHPMGCAASSEAAVPVEIVPEVQRSQRGAPPTKPDALPPPPSSPATGTRRPSSSAADVGSSVGTHLPAGGLPLTNSPQVAVDSVRRAWPSVMASGTVGEEDLKGTPVLFLNLHGHSVHDNSAPAGSQKQGINHCSTEFFPTHMVRTPAGRTARAQSWCGHLTVSLPCVLAAVCVWCRNHVGNITLARLITR